MLLKQTHDDRKTPINAKRQNSLHINALADKAIEIKISPIIVLILLKFSPFQRIFLAIGNIKAKITTKGDQIKNVRLSEFGGKGLFSSKIEENVFSGKVSIYPNPSSGILNLDMIFFS